MRVWEGGIEFGEFGEVCENDMVSLGEKSVCPPAPLMTPLVVLQAA